MAAPANRVKTETLSLRLDPKSKFMLDFMARVNGQTITTAVERAITAAANTVTIGNDPAKNWAKYWDVDEGVRTVRLLADKDYPKSFEEDELYWFIDDHWEFFFSSLRDMKVRRYYVELLWPKRDEYLEIWRTQRQTNYWAAGEAMKRDIEAAGLDPPEWPRPSADTKKKKPERETFNQDLDDEIPF